MSFAGFSKDGVRFFKELGARQDRDWFKANKERFVSLWEAPMRELMNDIGPSIVKQYKGYALKPPKVFRIYRDTRFSKDKSPFKTSLAAMIGFAGSEEEGAAAALYLHLGLSDVVGAGWWQLPAEKLSRYRSVVAADKTGKELQRRVDALQKKGLKVEAFEALKRVPKGFDPEHPRAALLKQKGLGVTFPQLPKNVRYSPKLAGWVVKQSAHAASLVAWLEEQIA